MQPDETIEVRLRAAASAASGREVEAFLRYPLRHHCASSHGSQ